MNKELLTKLKHKKEAYGSQKKGQVTQEEYRDTVWEYRDGVRKAKAHLELTFTKDIKGSKKSSYCYITSKWINTENKASFWMGWVT